MSAIAPELMTSDELIDLGQEPGEFVIKCAGMPAWWQQSQPGTQQPDVTGKLLAHYNPDAQTYDAMWSWTDDVEQAMRFVSVVAAMRCWNQRRRRARDERQAFPLRAFWVMILRVEDADAVAS